MAEKNIQMSQRNSTNDGWDNLYPKTKATNVTFTDGTSVEAHGSDEMPHKYTDSTNGKTYKWGMGSENDVPYFIREEIV